MTSSPISSWQIDKEKVETVTILFSWASKSLPMVTREHIKKQRRDFANKGLSSQSFGFSSGHVRM